jgi:hypothetical protein
MDEMRTVTKRLKQTDSVPNNILLYVYKYIQTHSLLWHSSYNTISVLINIALRWVPVPVVAMQNH